ncbi:MAG: hypothetical protein U0446_07090 [Dehalococcoidia bacterium]
MIERRRTPIRLRTAALVLGVLAALVPAALFAAEVGQGGANPVVVAQATQTATLTATPTSTSTVTPTATATRTASPTAPQTGSAGFLNDSGSMGMALVLVGLAVGVVAGGRMLSRHAGAEG